MTPPILDEIRRVLRTALLSTFNSLGFPRGFRISGQLLWSSVAPMQLGAWRLRRCISRRAPKIESFFESRE